MPPSRPIPELREPPNGAVRSRTKKQFTQTVPATSRALTRSARLAVARVQDRGQAVVGVVRERDRLVLVGERLQR